MSNKLFKNSTRMISSVAITLVVAASVGMNANYVFNNYYHSLFMLISLAAVAISFDTLKAFLLGWSVTNFSKGIYNLHIAVSQVFVWLLLVSISVMIALANVSDAVMTNPIKEAEVKKLENKLNELDHVRSLATLMVLKTDERSKIDEKIIRATKNCTDITRPESRRACLPVIRLRLEESQSHEKEKFQLRYDQISSAAYGLDPTNAAMLISMLVLEVTGRSVSPEKIDIYRIVIFALAIELIAAMVYFLMIFIDKGIYYGNTKK